MASPGQTGGAVEFSVDKIELTNYYNVESAQPGAFQQRITYHVQNKSNFSRKVRVAVDDSSDPAYQLLKGAEEHYLAAGLKLPIVLEYSPADSGCHRGEIIIFVDDKPSVMVPIEAVPPMTHLEFSPSLIDFGYLVCEHQLACRSLTVTNAGSKTGKFSFLADQLPHGITISPMQMMLEPGQAVDVKVEMLCVEEGSFSEHLRITVDDVEETLSLIPLSGVIISPQLELLDPSNSSCNLDKVAFGNVYYNTTVSRSVLLFNNSPVSSRYLAVIDSNAEGTVDGLNVNEGLAMVCTDGGHHLKPCSPQDSAIPGETLVQVIPMQGSLDPYEKKMLEITFAPQYEINCSGWTHHQSLPLHRDYALFIQFLQVGTNKMNQRQTLEVVITGTARALQLTVQPGTTLDFGSCVTGQISTKEIQLCNGSDVLPVDFQCQHVAHYKCLPSSGRILPGRVLTVKVTFRPRQLGPLNHKMNIDLLWPNKGKSKETFSSIALDLHGDGIHPVVIAEEKKRVAHPNDLTTSVRPHDQNLPLVTPYTGVPRYTYTDPDYSYNLKEARHHKEHKQDYINYSRERQAQRLWKKQEKALLKATFASEMDVIVPHTGGLKSPPLPLPKMTSSTIGTLRHDSKSPDAVCSNGPRMLTFNDIDNWTSAPLELIEKCPSKPMNFEVASHCKSELTPAELNQIMFEPAVLDFGSVLVNTEVEKYISVKNFSKRHIKVGLKLTGAKLRCKEYDRDAVFILAPQTFTKLSLSMLQHSTGSVERSMEYNMNDHHSGHLPVKANVMPLSLSLSTTRLALTEPYLASKAAGLRGSVVIANEHSVAVKFQWHAREEVDTEIFYMMHPSGSVPAGCNLECEFVCQPSYDCPASAQFLLAVGSGVTNLASGPQHSILTLIPKFDQPLCNFREKRLLFGTVPLNLTTVRSIHLENKGSCHAFFKIRDSSPHPGMNVYCETSCVPVGGAVELKVELKPRTTGQFDVKLYIDLKEAKCISFRMAGSVENPSVSINKDIFRFGGVYCGSTATIPFIVSNKGSARAQLMFDLSYLSEFALVVPSGNDCCGNSDCGSTGKVPGIYTIDLPRKSEVPCELRFSPQTVASYDYQLPVLVNGLKAPSPPPSPWPPSNAPSNITLTQSFEPSFSQTPIRRVLATVLQSPLLVSNTFLNFSLHPGFLDEEALPIQHQQTCNVREMLKASFPDELHWLRASEREPFISTEATVIKLTNVSEGPVSWTLDCSDIKRLDDETFQLCPLSGVSGSTPLLLPTTISSSAYLQPGDDFVFTAICCPSHHGSFTASIPLILNGDISNPYRIIELRAILPAGRISVDPDHILLQPVPLQVSVVAQFTVFIEYFTSSVELEASVPKLEDHVNLAVKFPAGSTVSSTCCNKVGISCQLEFSSAEPISKSDYIIICDKASNARKRIPFTVVADNSLFTVYTFHAQHFNSAPVKQKSHHQPNQLQELRYSKERISDSSLSLNSASFDRKFDFTASSTFMEIFIQDSVSSLCRWLSAYGWPGGVKSLLSPLDLRVRVGDDVPKLGVRQRSTIGTSLGLLVDLLTHLCGRAPPGIPLNLPPCTTVLEKVNQQYSIYDTIITFLRNQGGLLWCVTPEALLDYQDFHLWVCCQGTDTSGSSTFSPQSQDEFDNLSKQAWMHLLMQILKVLVLPRVINHVPEFLKEEVGSIKSFDDSIYSIPGRVLLAWLNFHYKNQKEKLSRGPDSGIQNFDVDLMDSIALSCVLIAYCPFLVETHFDKVYTRPSTPEQCSHNAVVFVSALKYICIDYDIQSSDLCSANPVSMILFVMHLYERMSAFKPKKMLTFEAGLGESVNQQLQVENATSKQMVYHILIRGDGAQDFHLANSTSTIMLAGHQSSQLDLSFHGHSLNSSSAVLFIVARGNNAAATTSVQAFKLLGTVTKAKPLVSSKLSAPLYDVQVMTLDVTSRFAKPGLFQMSLSEASNENMLSNLASSDTRTKFGGRVVMIPATSLQNRSDDQMHMFELVDGSQIHLESGHSAAIVLKFVPLTLRPRHCAIVLKSKCLGDIVLSVYATVKHPKPIIPESRFLHSATVVNSQTRTLHLKTHAGQTINEEIIICRNNAAFENAMLEICKWHMSPLEMKRRNLSKSFKYAILSTAIATLGMDNESKSCKDGLQEGSEKIVFSVEGNDSEHFKFPQEVSLLVKSGGIAILPIQFHADSGGQYECRLILKSLYDIRVIIIESTVLAMDRHAQIEFETKATVPVTQDIPLVNPSTVDWPLVATVNGIGFRGPEFVIAEGLATTPYPLTFSPKREGISEGELHLVNTTDKSKYQFQLKGIADRPIAQDHVRLHVQAKTSLTHILHIHNHHDRTMVFRVESDLDFVSGPSTITIGGDDVIDYPLSVAPKRQGCFTGAVAFVAQAVGRPHSFSESLESPPENCAPFHIWFRVECVVDAAPPDRTVTVSCPTLSSSTVQLNVTNPYSYLLKLQVLLEGHGLLGPDYLEVQPNGEALYPLIFAPNLAGQTKGRVVFDSRSDGEFWYELCLIADNPKPTNISPILCDLGKTCSQTVSLTNPLDIPVRFKCHNSNTKHFVVIGLAEGQVKVDPCSSVDVRIIFKPSAIGSVDHAAELHFTSKQFGRHTFILQGQGVCPSAMDPVTITADVKSSRMQIINFINPLDIATHFSVSLKGQDIEHFCLLMKRTTSILLHPGVSLDIPIMFAPEVMCGHKANVIIVADESCSGDCTLCWRYPVIGQPELRMDSTSSLNVKCKAKERFEQEFSVTLMNSLDKIGSAAVQNAALRTGRLTETSYSYKLVCCDGQLGSLVEKSTGIRLLGKKKDSNADADDTALEFVIIFTPPKAFECSCDLYITGEGAVWIFPLCFLATPAAPDDVVVIEAAGLKKKARLNFRLNSLTECPMPFTARMTSDSDSEICVSPTCGELAPASSPGTLFYITYKPSLYGRKHQARFIVQSDSNEWCYDIVGKIPTLSGLTGVQAKVQHKRTRTIPDSAARNYLHENMRLLSMK